MIKTTATAFFYLAFNIGLFVCCPAVAQSLKLCSKIEAVRKDDNQKSRISLFLIDPRGNLSNGPIEFGKFVFHDAGEYIFYIPTKYRVIAASESIEPVNDDVGGSLKLTSTERFCPHTKTFNVELVSRRVSKDLLPFKIDDIVSESNFQIASGSNSDGDLTPFFRFSGRIKGMILSGE